MPYASAAGSGAAGNGAEQPKNRYYNDNMVVCFANGIQYDQLAEELDKKGSMVLAVCDWASKS